VLLAGQDIEERETMRGDTHPLKLPHSIKKAAQRLAKEDGVSLNQWSAAAVAEKNRRSGNGGRVLQEARGKG
jgi:predicted HicB family RNase H-like nuclease